MIGMPDQFREPLPSLQIPVCARNGAGDLPQWNQYAQTLRCASARRGTAVVLHDSMGLGLLPTLPDQFRTSHWRRQSVWNVKEIASIAPEIVVEEIVERSMEQLAETWFLEFSETDGQGGATKGFWLHNLPFSVGSSPRSTSSCRLESVNGHEVPGVVDLRGDAKLEVSGWAGDATSASPPTAAWLVLSNPKGSSRLRLQTGLQRPDVALNLGSQNLSRSGFRGGAAIGDVQVGDSSATIVWNDAAGWAECKLNVAVRH